MQINLADLERRFRANEARWRTVDDVLEHDQRSIVDECSEHRDQIIRELERLPITSPADAVLAMGMALDTVDPNRGVCNVDPEEDDDELRAIRCLAKVLGYLRQQQEGET